MTIKQNNWQWMCLAVLSVGLMFVGIPSTWGISLLVEYGAVLLIGCVMLKKDGLRLTDALPYNKKGLPADYLIAIAMAFLLKPLASVLGEIVGIIAGDTTAQAFSGGSALANMSVPELLFTMAIIPAVFEEMFFRGFFYDGFKRAGGIRLSILVTAVLFGLFHMNLQQIIYATMLGIFIAILRELSGSMWPGMLYHFINNGWTILETVAQKKWPEDAFFFKLPTEQFSLTTDAGHTVYTLVMSVVCTAVLIWLLGWLGNKHGRLTELKSFFKPVSETFVGSKAADAIAAPEGETTESSSNAGQSATAKKSRIVTGPLVIGVLVNLGVSILLLVISNR